MNRNMIMTFDTVQDKRKFEEAYLRYNKVCYNFALDILNDPKLAEDAVHDAFLRLYNHLDKIDDGSSRRTGNYIITIVKNLCFTQRKKKDSKIIPLQDYDLDSNGLLTDSLVDEVVTYIEIDRMRREIDSLPDSLKEPLVLKYYNDLSNSEIGEILDVSADVVAVRIFRAKQKLAERLNKNGGVSVG